MGQPNLSRETKLSDVNGKICFPCSADHMKDWHLHPADAQYVERGYYTHTHAHHRARFGGH